MVGASRMERLPARHIGLLTTNRKSFSIGNLVPKSTTLDDLE